MGSQHRVERKLAAIFAADVEGYSRLMQADEAGTLDTLTACREIMDQLIAGHGGRIANTAGDSVLAEFPSVVDAVRCAVAVQEALADAERGIPEGRRVRFRIGVHMGDVIVRAGDLFGDGVNIAARLQALAGPGGVRISGEAHRCVRRILPLAYTDLGHRTVRNIEDPIRIFAVGPTTGVGMSSDTMPLSLPDKPSIAVLPFATMGGGPDQDYLPDGICEEITTALSRLHGFFVIARASAFTYKGKPSNVQQVSRELGVRYVLEGSVRRAGDRVRIGVHLADAVAGIEVWAERYERALVDLFALQDEIAASVVTAVEPQLYAAESARLQQKPPGSLDAWGCFIQALPHMWRFAVRIIALPSTCWKMRSGSIQSMPEHLACKLGSASGMLTRAGARAGWELFSPRPPRRREPPLRSTGTIPGRGSRSGLLTCSGAPTKMRLRSFI